MKRIIIVRHSKAVNREENLGDFERSLTDKGRIDSNRMAQRLKHAGIIPDLLISSPANRALETAHAFAEVLEYPPQKILLRDSIYDTHSTESFLYIFQELDDTHNSAAIFGHNPTMSEFADFLLDGFEHSIPKTAVVIITFETDKWNEIQPGNGKLEQYDFPSRKNRLEEFTELAESKIVAELNRNIKDVLAEMDREAAEEIERKIEKSSRKLARKFLSKARNFRITP